jgi:NADPH:quinone reductase-like Zn-dependent oxidoreductase
MGPWPRRRRRHRLPNARLRNDRANYDIVLDSQGGDTLAKSLRVLKPGGTAIGIAGPPDPDFARQQGLRLPLRLAITLLSLKTRRAARRHGVRYSFLLMRASGPQLDEITKLIDSDVLRPIIDRADPFDEAPQALAHVESGRTKGKVVITTVWCATRAVVLLLRRTAPPGP